LLAHTGAAVRALAAALLLCAVATPALAVPFCPGPRGGGVVLGFEVGKLGESERARFYEQRLRARGIDASDTRLWGGCIQTFVTENGHFTMRFYDPWTLEEIPLD
jgi:hypothetical protein